MEGECLSILRRAKEVSIKERQQMPKVNTKKSSFMSFGVSMIKPLVSSLDWLYIKEKVGFAL
jgi:hypothetical protein